MDFKFTASSNTCRYSAIGPSQESSNARLFNRLLLSLFDFHKILEAQDFSASEFFLKKSYFSLVMFPMFRTASTGGKVVFASALKPCRQCLHRISTHSARLLGWIHSYNSSSAQAK